MSVYRNLLKNDYVAPPIVSNNKIRNEYVNDLNF